MEPSQILLKISAWIAWREIYRMLPLLTHLFSHWPIPLRQKYKYSASMDVRYTWRWLRGGPTAMRERAFWSAAPTWRATWATRSRLSRLSATRALAAIRDSPEQLVTRYYYCYFLYGSGSGSGYFKIQASKYSEEQLVCHPSFTDTFTFWTIRIHYYLFFVLIRIRIRILQNASKQI